MVVKLETIYDSKLTENRVRQEMFRLECYKCTRLVREQMEQCLGRVGAKTQRISPNLRLRMLVSTSLTFLPLLARIHWIHSH